MILEGIAITAIVFGILAILCMLVLWVILQQGRIQHDETQRILETH